MVVDRITDYRLRGPLAASTDSYTCPIGTRGEIVGRILIGLGFVPIALTISYQAALAAPVYLNCQASGVLVVSRYLIRRRFGYRRLHVLLRREGIIMNHKKLRRLYREERLQVRRRGGRKRALGTRAPMTPAAGTSGLECHDTYSRCRRTHGPAGCKSPIPEIAWHFVTKRPDGRSYTESYTLNRLNGGMTDFDQGHRHTWGVPALAEVGARPAPKF